MKSVIFRIFFAIFSQESHQNLMWKIVTSSNLNLPLKLYFYSPILANNNILLKIYCENIVVAFLNCIFPFFLSIIHIIPFLFFFSLDFSPPHMYTHYLHPLLFFFFIYFPLHSRTFLSLSFSSSLSLLFFFFFFLLDSKTLSSSLCDKKRRKT